VITVHIYTYTLRLRTTPTAPEELTRDDQESPVLIETAALAGHVAEEETNLLLSHGNHAPRNTAAITVKRNRFNGPDAGVGASHIFGTLDGRIREGTALIKTLARKCTNPSIQVNRTRV
jgi:hypothetical protein